MRKPLPLKCPTCRKPLTVVYRGLVVTEYVAHPVENGAVDIDRLAVGPSLEDHFTEELQDGAYGVNYLCGSCCNDVSDLFDEDGQPLREVSHA